MSFEREDIALPLVGLSEEALRAPILNAAKEARKNAMLREHKRLLYVALTRAADELYITAAAPARGVGRESWYHLLQEIMAGHDNVVEEAGTRILAVPQIRPVVTDIPVAPARPPLPLWALEPAPAETRPQTFSPSRLMEQELSLYQQRETGARQRGVILHRWLESAPALAMAEARRDLLARLAPEWDAPTLAASAAQMEQLLAEPELRWIWQEKGYNEIAITGMIEVEGVPQRFHGQIDRLVMAGNQIVILDYKTAWHPPLRTEIPAAYLWQMKAYQQLLSRKYPDKIIRPALLWTSLPRLDWLEDDIATLEWNQPREAS